MKIDFDAEERDIAAVAASVLAKQLPLSTLRALAADVTTPAIDAATWQSCADLGWFGLGVPESCGGIGYGVYEEAALFVELGRHLAPGPFLGTVVAAWVAAEAGVVDLGAELMGGGVRAGLAVDSSTVVDASVDDVTVVFREGAIEVRDIVSARPLSSIDPSVRLTQVELGAVLARSDDPLLTARAQLLAAAMELGIAEAVRDMSVDYAKTRKQFGVAIGSFQAVKHRCADMAIRAYAAEGQLMYALRQLSRRADDAMFHASATRLVTTDAAIRNAADNVQNHGAIGFTEEHDAGLFSRRAHVLQFFLGDRGDLVATVLSPQRNRYENAPETPDHWLSELPELSEQSPQAVPE